MFAIEIDEVSGVRAHRTGTNQLDHVRFTFQQESPDTLANFPPPRCEQTISQRTPFLPKSSDYYCYIESFSVPTDQIALMIPSGSDTTLYSVSIRDAGGIFYNRNIIVSALETYTSLAFHVNNALLDAWVAFRVANPGVGTVPPFISLNPIVTPSSTNSPPIQIEDAFALYMEQGIWNGDGPVSLYFSAALFNLIPFQTGVASPFEPLPAANPNHQVALIQVIGGLTNEYIQPALVPPHSRPLTGKYWVMQQTSPSLFTWASNFRSLVFLTSMPVTSQYLPGPGGAGSQLPVVMEYFPEQVFENEEKPDPIRFNEFTGGGGRRLVDMTNDQPLTSLNLSVHYRDVSNQLVPVTMSPGKYWSATVCFVRRAVCPA